MLHLGYQVKIIDLLKRGMSLVEFGLAYGKNKSSNFSMVVNTMHPEHLWISLHRRSLHTIHLQELRLYDILEKAKLFSHLRDAGLEGRG
jgi:hypothetical protein